MSGVKLAPKLVAGQVARAHGKVIARGARTIPAETVEAIRALSPIEAVIGEDVRLRRSGLELVGLCPFHDERTPSFAVNLSKQVFHCHGCHVGGDVFAYVQRRVQCGFRDAVAHLAQRAGIEIEGFRPSPELRARVEQKRAARDKEIAFERFRNDRIDAITNRFRALGRAATSAEEYLRMGILRPDEQLLAWDALKAYRDFEAQVERQGLCDMEYLRHEWAARKGGQHAAA